MTNQDDTRRQRRRTERSGAAAARDEVDLLRQSVHPSTGTAPQGVGHGTRRRALERLRHPPPPTAEQLHRERGRRTRRYLTLVIVLAVAAAAGFFAWNTLFADRGEVLHFGDEALPDQSGRIAQHSIVRIGDPEEFRARVDERTGAIILDADRMDELGRDWLGEQYAQGIAIATIGDLSPMEITQRIGADHPRATGSATNAAFGYAWQACDGSSASGGSFGAPFHFNSLRSSLVNVLDRERDDRRC